MNKKLVFITFLLLIVSLFSQAQTFVNTGNSANAPAYYNGTGNVGIGTTTPAFKLDVNSASATYLARINNTNTVGRGLFVQQTTTATGTQEVVRFSKLVGTTESPLFIVRADNKVGIGTTLSGTLPSDANQFRLFVKDGIRTEKVKVDLATTGWGDYVFSPSYRLRPLSEVATFIHTNKHLPDVPSEKELQANGLDLGEMQKIQMVKIEELTLYLLELKKENESLKKRIETLENQKKDE